MFLLEVGRLVIAITHLLVSDITIMNEGVCSNARKRMSTWFGETLRRVLTSILLVHMSQQSDLCNSDR